MTADYRLSPPDPPRFVECGLCLDPIDLGRQVYERIVDEDGERLAHSSCVGRRHAEIREDELPCACEGGCIYEAQR